MKVFFSALRRWVVNLYNELFGRFRWFSCFQGNGFFCQARYNKQRYFKTGYLLVVSPYQNANGEWSEGTSQTKMQGLIKGQIMVVNYNHLESLRIQANTSWGFYGVWSGCVLGGSVVMTCSLAVKRVKTDLPQWMSSTPAELKKMNILGKL